MTILLSLIAAELAAVLVLLALFMRRPVPVPTSASTVERPPLADFFRPKQDPSPEKIETAIREHMAGPVDGYDFELTVKSVVQRLERMHHLEGQPLPEGSLEAVRKMLAPHA